MQNKKYLIAYVPEDDIGVSIEGLFTYEEIVTTLASEFVDWLEEQGKETDKEDDLLELYDESYGFYIPEVREIKNETIVNADINPKDVVGVAKGIIKKSLD